MNKQPFDFSTDLLKVILWQYNDATKLQTLLTEKQQWLTEHHSQFWDNWIKDVFDLTTANEFGLAVWAHILEMPVIAELAASDADAPAFGFENGYQNFDHGNFFASNSSTTRLSTAQKRMLLRLRYFQLVSNGTIPEINQFLKTLFDNAFVLDTLDMSYAIYVFNDDVSSDVQFLLEQFDLLPRPAGVGYKTRYTKNYLFGFGNHNHNFNHGVLADINSL